MGMKQEFDKHKVFTGTIVYLCIDLFAYLILIISHFILIFHVKKVQYLF